MDTLLSYLPPSDQGFMPYYLFIVGIVAVGNSFQNLITLHYTRRLYPNLFVPNPAVLTSSTITTVDKAGKKSPADRVDRLIPASPTGKDAEKAQDQITPLAARLFGTWTLMAGVIRVYAAHNLHLRPVYELALMTHVIATAHYLSELLIFKTCGVELPQLFPLFVGPSGTIWMLLQYSHYVKA